MKISWIKKSDFSTSDILTAFIIGVFISLALILNSIFHTVYAESETGVWNSIVSSAQGLSWGEVFTFNEGKDLYLLTYKTLNIDADDDALLDMAKSNGLTSDEAKAVLAGSVTPLLTKEDYGSKKITQDQALKIVNGFQNDFRDLREIYQIQKEIEVAVTPSEIFANGNVSDSGFDLIVDLNIIEEILFLESDDIEVGNPYSDSLAKPFSPSHSNLGEIGDADSTVDTAIRQIDSINQNLESSLLDEDGNPIPVDILKDDVCEYDNALADALSDFDSNNNNLSDANDPDAPDDSNEENPEDVNPENPNNNPNLDENGDLVPAESDDWINEWCQNGGGDNAQASICISFEYVDEVYRSYTPGQSCILCEITKINKSLDQTLSHSLIPNKATGNLMESGKCKQAAALNFQFIVGWNPIPSPPNDDIVFGKNIFDEWNNFTERYRPLLLYTEETQETSVKDSNDEGSDDEDSSDEDSDSNTSSTPSEDDILQKRSESLPNGISNSELFTNVSIIRATYQAEAMKNINDYNNADDNSNDLLYNKNVLMEIKEMNKLFNALFKTFNDINEKVIPEIQGKPSIG